MSTASALWEPTVQSSGRCRDRRLRTADHAAGRIDNTVVSEPRSRATTAAYVLGAGGGSESGSEQGLGQS